MTRGENCEERVGICWPPLILHNSTAPPGGEVV